MPCFCILFFMLSANRGKRGDYQNCSVLYCVLKLHTVLSVPDMTYNVFGGMLNLTQSINHALYQQQQVEGIVFSGCMSVCPSVLSSVHCPPTSVLHIAIISILSGGIRMELCANVHHVSQHCRKTFQGRRSVSNYMIVK